MAKTLRPRGPQSAEALSNAELEKAARFLAAGDVPRAAAVLDGLQKRVQGEPRVYLLAMQIAEASGRGGDALTAARLAAQVAPTWPVAAMEHAMCLSRRHRYREAVAEAERAVALSPDDPHLRNGVIQIAQRAGLLAVAVKHLPRLIELMHPANAEWKALLARDLTALGRPAEALPLYEALLVDAPTDTTLRQGRAHAAQAAGDSTLACQDWEALCDQEPDNEAFRFALAVARGEPPATRPAAVMRALFDEMAEVYDQRMVRQLGYQLPKTVADWILSEHPDRKLNVLDLGCGTGLLGVCLGRLDGALIGVDISPRMIEQAHRHGLYDRFHAVDLLDALRDTPAGTFDLVAALDVFSYVGDLTRAVADAARILKPGGTLVLSCERTGDGEPALSLHPNGRYAHQQAAVEAALGEAGFTSVHVNDCVLYKEQGKPVEGYWIVAHKA